MNVEQLVESINEELAELIQACDAALGEVTVIVTAAQLRELCLKLRDHTTYQCNLLVDICGVDYLDYGKAGWRTEEATFMGFSRGVEVEEPLCEVAWKHPRFAVVYHLLSLTHNQRVRVCVFIEGEPPVVDSVVDIWAAANWFEREAFDLFGILFTGHPDLRRILTDYDFVGHPFRKDFPLIGQVEMRYDAGLGRCVYEPVSIQPRVVIPKVIRHD